MGSTDRLLFSPDHRVVVTGWWSAQGRGAELWDTFSGRRMAAFTNMTALAFSSDNRMLAGQTVNFRVKVVNVATKTELIFTPGLKMNSTAAAFSGDGKLLATTSYDGDARLWSVESGQASYRLKGHKQEVHCVTFSPDGKTLVTGSADGEVKFWNVATGKELFSLRIPGADLRLVQFSLDSRTLVVQDSRHVFRVPSLAEIDALQQPKLNRD